jgi:potassium uptake TrkH family protein
MLNLKLSPSAIFVGSFLILIIIGTGLLLLPNATNAEITPIDALFMSTSAVCVTGLAVLDVGQDFTLSGQYYLMLLFQLGGLGMMTFTSFFGLFFRGDTSFGDRLMLKELTRASTLKNVLSTLISIVLITFLVETIGAIGIFLLIKDQIELSTFQNIHFSIFHAISAFCNAGFSTLPNGLAEIGFEHNYTLHLLIAGLFIFGGLGFPIVFNTLRFFQYWIIKQWYRIIWDKRLPQRPNLYNLNTRLILRTTFFLLLGGTFLFFLLEYNNTLAGKTLEGKIVTAFFGAATPRTAGFNTIDTAILTSPMILITIFLMWIGASPGSTGGGIKTSTFAIACLNIISTARQKDRIEYHNRQIDNVSIQRAFTVIALSIITIFIGLVLLTFFEPDKTLETLFFETVSAYSTVGLSMGITAGLSAPGKIVLVLIMFIGRVGTISLLIILFRRSEFLSYHYPKERIMIN